MNIRIVRSGFDHAGYRFERTETGWLASRPGKKMTKFFAGRFSTEKLKNFNCYLLSHPDTSIAKAVVEYCKIQNNESNPNFAMIGVRLVHAGHAA